MISCLRKRAFAAILLAAAPNLLAQAAPEADSPAVVTHAYDVSDLLPTTQPAKAALTELATLVQQSIEPDSWDSEHKVLIAAEQARTLVVMHTASVQEKVGGLLRDLQAVQAVQVTVAARYLVLPEGLAQEAQKMTVSASPFLTPQRVSELIRLTQTSSDAAVVTAPRVTVYSGQEAMITVTTSTSYVQTLQLTKSGNVGAYTPVIASAEDGIILKINAAATADRRSAILTLSSTNKRLLGLTNFTFAKPSPALTIQQPHTEEVATRITAIIPSAQTLLLGPLPIPPEQATTSPAAPTTQPTAPTQLFLLITPTVIHPHPQQATSPDPRK